MSEHSSESTTLDESHPSAEEVQSGSEESAMAQESPKNAAAEIPVTSNGQLEDSHEYSFNRVIFCFYLKPYALHHENFEIFCSTTYGNDKPSTGFYEVI